MLFRFSFTRKCDMSWVSNNLYGKISPAELTGIERISDGTFVLALVFTDHFALIKLPTAPVSRSAK